MSCHNIGRGMDSVARVVISLYDEGKFDKDTARRLLVACREGVNWCDGNTDEAIASIRSCRCGRCLAKIVKGEKLFSVWDVSDEVKKAYDILDTVTPPLAADRLCEVCFDEVIDGYCGISGAGEREKKYIMEGYDERDYISEGE